LFADAIKFHEAGDFAHYAASFVSDA
jgi:hypothetical protein